jgi:hypothetical protein
MISYIIYIIILITIYFFFNILLKIITYIKSAFNNFFKKKNSSSIVNFIKCVGILKNNYGIKSTEKTKTNINFKLIVKKPTYLNINKINNNINTHIQIKKNDNLKCFIDNKNNYKIIKSYISNKKNFHNMFIKKNGNFKIKNLKTFSIFHKKNFNNNIEKNILLKFYNNDIDYIYIFVNDNNLIKILNFEEFDKITELIENNNNIFLISENINENYISHGGYINCDVSKKELKKIFFNNSNKINKKNKNYNILVNYKSIKIFFYISTLI